MPPALFPVIKQRVMKAQRILLKDLPEEHEFMLGLMLETCCIRCGAFEDCEFAYASYNVNCEPKIDCLASK